MKTLSVSTVAKIEGMSRQALNAHCQKGHIKGVKKNDIGMWLIPENYSIISTRKAGRPPMNPISR